MADDEQRAEVWLAGAVEDQAARYAWCPTWLLRDQIDAVEAELWAPVPTRYAANVEGRRAELRVKLARLQRELARRGEPEA